MTKNQPRGKKSQLKPRAKGSAKSASKSGPRVESRGESRGDAKRGAKAGAKSGANKPRTKSGSKAAAKPTTGPTTRSTTRSTTRAATKPSVQTPADLELEAAADEVLGGDAADAPPAPLAGERLQKVLAQAGMGSRRDMERWIVSGRVMVNGERAELGQRVLRSDRVQVDGGKPLRSVAANHRVLLINKNEGVVCTRRDPEGRDNVFRGLPRLKTGRWISVGRLDINSSGLLLMCTDGELANRMMHPSTGLDREYAVRVNGELEDAAIARLIQGVEIEGEKHSFSDLRYFNGSGMNHWYHVVLMEGKNREVRRLFESEGLQVSRLKRVRYGPVMLPPWLSRGEIGEMNADDTRALYRLLNLPVRLPRSVQVRQGNSERERKRARSVLIPYPGLTPGGAPVS